MKIVWAGCLAISLGMAAGRPAGAASKDSGYIEKVVTCYRQECRQEKVPMVVKKIYFREETRAEKTTVLVSRVSIEKRPQVVEITVPRDVLCEVTRCRRVPVKIYDKETGLTVIVFKEEVVKEKVKVTYYDKKTQTVMVDCKVKRLVPEERIVHKKIKVPQYRDETVLVTKTSCVMVPYQRIIRVERPNPLEDIPPFLRNQ